MNFDEIIRDKDNVSELPINPRAGQKRKGLIDNTELTHVIHDEVEDHILENDEEDETPDIKDQYFEFLDSYYVMRFIRFIFFIQILALILDSSSIELPAFFDISLHGLLYYSIHFYSRPFLDIIYILQYFWDFIVDSIKANSEIPSTPTGVEVARKLITNPFKEKSIEKNTFFEWQVNLMDEQNFHSIKYYSHYFLGLFFVILSLLFTFRLWEISDYSNRDELKLWLYRYIADGWVKRGGFNILKSILFSILTLLLFILIFYATTKSFGNKTLFYGLLSSSIFVVGLSTVLTLWILFLLVNKAIEKSFTRYVSQNVAYTSMIILKRTIKAKIDIGIIFFCTLFIPVTYTTLKGMILQMDWNDLYALSSRIGFNYDVPCYNLAFPPFREHVNPDTCSLNEYISPHQASPHHGYFYHDKNILQCGSYWGIIIHVFSTVCFIFLIAIYFYVIYTSIDAVNLEFRNSRVVEILIKLLKIRDEETIDYSKRFSLKTRLIIGTISHIQDQIHSFKKAFRWCMITILTIINFSAIFLFKMIRWIILPLELFIEKVIFNYLQDCYLYIINFFKTKKVGRVRSVHLLGSKKSNKIEDVFKSTSHIGIANSIRKWRQSSSLLPTDEIISKKHEEAQVVQETNNEPVNNNVSAPPSPTNRKKVESAHVKKSTGSKKINAIGFDFEYDENKNNNNDDDEDMDFLARIFILILSEIFAIFGELISVILDIFNYIRKIVIKSPFIAYLRVRFNLFYSDFKNKYLNFGETGTIDKQLHGYASLGGAHAKWRKVQTLSFKHNTIKRMKFHIVKELRVARKLFIAQHELLIGFFDYAIDSSGLFSLIVSFNYEFYWWFLVVLAEMLIYIIIGASTLTTVHWSLRNYAFLAINAFFGCVTYIFNPYTEPTDMWMDFISRLILGIIFIGLIIYSNYVELNQYDNSGIGIEHYPLFHNISISNLDPTSHLYYLYTIYEGVIDRLSQGFGGFTLWEAQQILSGRDDLNSYNLTDHYGEIHRTGGSSQTLLSDGVPFNAPIYEPWTNIGHIFGTIITIDRLNFGLLVDIFMVVVFYIYFVYLLHLFGLFNMIYDMIKSIQYAMHDHILDYLIDKLDERSFGFENIYSGLQFIQQWDEIIKHQRSYALFAPVDVRPTYLISTLEKFIEVKWASFFNLTLKNLRSSLGLTILHSTLFNADGDISRWIIHRNPDLLHVQDSQQDTPVTIALKECAYFLLIYGNQNNGRLDDGTSFGDEDYAVYYPEVDEYRDEIFMNGEFLSSFSYKTQLSASDINKMRSDYTLLVNEAAIPDYFGIKNPALSNKNIKRSQKNIKKGKDEVKIDPVISEHLKELNQLSNTIAQKKDEDLLKQQLKHERRHEKYFNNEKKSIMMKRFIEDGIHDEFESGRCQAWTLLGYNVPMVNLYLDVPVTKKIMKIEWTKNDVLNQLKTKLARYQNDLMKKNPPTNRQQLIAMQLKFSKHNEILQRKCEELYHFHYYENYPSINDVNRDVSHLLNTNAAPPAFNANEDEINEITALLDTIELPSTGVDENDVYSEFPIGNLVEDDLKYLIPSQNKISKPDRSLYVPLDEGVLKELPDWDSIKYKSLRKEQIQRETDAASDFTNNFDYGKLNAISDPYSHLDFPPPLATSNSFVSQIDLQSLRSYNSFKDKFMGGSTRGFFTLRKQDAFTDTQVRWKICKFAEIFMSSELSNSFKDRSFDIDAFKNFQRLATLSQGKLAQHLTLCCHLNAPPGFVRISHWSKKLIPDDVFDENTDENVSSFVKAIVTVVDGVEKVIDYTSKAIDTVTNLHVGKNSLRARARRSRSTSLASRARDTSHEEVEVINPSDVFSDRILHFLSESLCCSTKHLNLNDYELSYEGRRGWRAISRALRRKYCTFIMPSILTPPKPILLLSLTLSFNELDCGDCVYLADALLYQKEIKYLNLSHNKVGARGMMRLCKVLKDHPNIKILNVSHNIIGPVAGKDIGLLLKYTKSLEILNISNNSMGEIVQFPNPLTREYIPSAIPDISRGMKYNKTIQILDLSYNKFGPSSADCLPFALNKHPKIHTLHFDGNNLGPVKGANFIFLLAGAIYGVKYYLMKNNFIEKMKNSQAQRNKLNKKRSQQNLLEDEKNEEELLKNASNTVNLSLTSALEELDPNQEIDDGPKNNFKIDSNSINKKKNRNEDELVNLANAYESLVLDNYRSPVRNLVHITLSNNQLGDFCGYAIAFMLDKMKYITHLDVSRNALGPLGCERILDQIELLYKITPRDFFKKVLFDIEESKYHGRNARKKKKIYTNLTSLNLSSNNMGPKCLASIGAILEQKNCGIIDLILDDNPLGLSNSDIAGNAAQASLEARKGFLENKSLRNLQISRCLFRSTEMVTLLGGLGALRSLCILKFDDVPIDEPSCLQLSTLLDNAENLTQISLRNCKLGANGGSIITQKLSLLYHQLEFIDISCNFIGSMAAIHLARNLNSPDCRLKHFILGSNDFMEEGGAVLCLSLHGNTSIEELDLSNNLLGHKTAVNLSQAARGVFHNGVKVSDAGYQKIILNNNPNIGFKGSKILFKAFSNSIIKQLEMRNIGAGPQSADEIAFALRDPSIGWQYLDVSNNHLTRFGVNQIFWALRQNQRCRRLKIGMNEVGNLFCTSSDALLCHGIAVPVAIKTNLVLRELDLSFSSLTPEAGINILDAVIDNHCLKRLSLKGNLLDDTIADLLPDFFRCNTVIEEIDLSYNKLGYATAYAIGQGLENNRNLKKLYLHYNELGNAGLIKTNLNYGNLNHLMRNEGRDDPLVHLNSTMESFINGLKKNITLQVLTLDGNKIGSKWIIEFAIEIIASRNTFGSSSGGGGGLYSLSLRDNKIDGDAAMILINAYSKSSSLILLHISKEEIGNLAYELWKEVIKEKVSTGSIQISDEDAEEFDEDMADIIGGKNRIDVLAKKGKKGLSDEQDALLKSYELFPM